MKSPKQYIGFALLVFLGGMMSSCVKEKIGEKQGNAVVDLTFHTRSESDVNANGENDALIADNENFKTIRVIVTDGSNKILKNIYDENLPEGGVSEYKLRIVNLPANKPLKFYVVGNEESVGKGDYLSQLKSGESLASTEVINSEAASYFPKMRNQINELGLPITGVAEVQSLTGDVNTPHHLDIPCTHSVVKVVLNINNLMEETFWIRGAHLGKFITNGTYLFSQVDLSLPVNVSTEEYAFVATTQGIQVNPGENNEAFVFYMYETGDIPYHNYSLWLESLTVPELKEPKYIFGEGEGSKFLKRNQQLNINATIDVQKEVTVSITYKVMEWKPVSVEVPSFN
ncbi:hypothetical protein [Phocaeicola plebeius]|uniref:hypothetical protein n=1 Tax=Phocaeicola plebeius TaxID=310297 RepID=UPI003F9E9B11